MEFQSGKAKLNQKDFLRIADFVENNLGIKLPDKKLLMVESRLAKRLRILKISNYSEYCDFLFSAEGKKNEIYELINAITTNKTDFFREPKHFEHLVAHTLPELITKGGAGIKKKLIIWSCGCSYGMEAYTLAMVLSEFACTHPGLNFDFMILATDISRDVLKTGQNAVYSMDSIAPVPTSFKKKYLLKSKSNKKQLVRIVPELRNKVKFRELNLLDKDYKFREKIDIIFFRNVMIYFEEDTKMYILQMLFNHLRPNGYLYIGHSENLHRINPGFKKIGATIYHKE